MAQTQQQIGTWMDRGRGTKRTHTKKKKESGTRGPSQNCGSVDLICGDADADAGTHTSKENKKKPGCEFISERGFVSWFGSGVLTDIKWINFAVFRKQRSLTVYVLSSIQ